MKFHAMKKLLLIAPIMLFFASCKPYQYFTVAAPELQQDSLKQYVFENDTMKVLYNFTGYQGPLKVTVINKLKEPIFLDWNRSAMIMNGESVALYQPSFQFSGRSVGSSVEVIKDVSLNSSRMSGTLSGQEGVDMIPPGSSRQRSVLAPLHRSLLDAGFNTENKKYFDDDKTSIRGRFLDYSESSTPLIFKTCFSFRLESTPDLVRHFESRFFIKDVFVTIAGPDQVGQGVNRGDRFYTK